MNCAKCWTKGVLLLEHHEGVTVMECTKCVGFWLDRNDIFDIVDVKFTEAQLKSMFEVTDKNTKFTCLHCGSLLKEVNYKAEKLAVGICPLGHGWYWENPKKEKRETWMKKREKALVKQFKTKKTWKEFLKGVKTWELIDKLREGLSAERSGIIAKAVKEHEKMLAEFEARRLAKAKEARAKMKKEKKTGKKKPARKVTKNVVNKTPAKRRGRPKKK